MRRFCTSLHYCTSQSGLSNAQLSWNKLNDTIHCKQYKIKYSTKSTLQPAMPFSNLNLGRLVKLSGEQVPDFSSLCPQIHEIPTEKAPIHEIRTCYVCWLSLLQIFNQVCHVCQKEGRCPEETVPTGCIALCLWFKISPKCGRSEIHYWSLCNFSC